MKQVFILALFCILFSCSKQEINENILLYIGTASSDPEEGISYCYFNTKTGELSQPQIATKIIGPNFIHVDSEKKHVYAVGALINKESNQKQSVVCSYSIDSATNQLNKISEVSTYGDDPCFVEFNRDKNLVLSANYSSGNVSFYKDTDGKLSHIQSSTHYGTGPNKNRQEKPHAHSIRVDPTNRYAYAADLGADKIMVYNIASDSIQIQDSVTCKPGAGPRHLDFSPGGDMMAVLNELNSTVTTFEKDSNGIYKNEVMTIAMLPDTFKGFSKAADIHFSPDGQFLYASNRGFNSIAIFKVMDKKLQFVEWETEGINWPRNFSIDPSGKFILVANRDSDNITVYKRDLSSGSLTRLNYEVTINKPVCIKFIH